MKGHTHGHIRIPRFLFFAMFRGRGGKPRVHRPITAEGYKRMDEFWKEFREIRKHEKPNPVSFFGLTGGGSIASRSRVRVPEQPQEPRPEPAGSQPRAAGSDRPAIVSDSLGWDALEQQLLDMVQENPELREVEVKHE